MGILHRIDGDIVEIIVAGHFSIDELLTGFRLTIEDEHLPPNSLVLINVTDSEEIPPFEVIKQISMILSAGSKKLGSRIAIVVAQTVRYGRARQLGMLLEYAGLQSQPFYDRKTAVEWLHAEEV
ncbi:MAG: hypothetical protein WA946_04780 [Nitrospirota bacterium]